MNSELSLQERDILVKLLRKLIARPRPADLQGRVLDALVTWQKANDGRPMPMWSLERKTQSKKEELMPILEELAADGRGANLFRSEPKADRLVDIILTKFHMDRRA